MNREGGSGTEHRELRELLGGHALEQLDGPDTDRVRDHLSTCPTCPSELAELEPVVASLRAARPNWEGISTPEPPADLGERVLGRVRAQQLTPKRPGTWARGALAATAVAAALVFAFVLGVRLAPEPTSPQVIPLDDLVLASGIEAEAGLVRHTWGTELQLRATGLTQGTVYTVTFVRDDGREFSAGGVIGVGQDPLTCSVNAGLPIEEASELTIADPTGAPVISADLP